MKDKKPYNTIDDTQLDIMMKNTIDKLDMTGNEDDLDQLIDDCEELFFDLYDENYTLWCMSARQAEDFTMELRSGFYYFLEKDLEISE